MPYQKNIDLWYYFDKISLERLEGKGRRTMNSVYSIDELKTTLNPIFKEQGVNKAVLFGSYAKGLADEKSDIDILVDSGLKGFAFFGLLEMVSTALRVPVDLIDVRQVEEGSPVDNEIKKSGLVIYEQ